MIEEGNKIPPVLKPQQNGSKVQKVVNLIGSIVFRGLALIVGSASLFVCYSMLMGDAEFNANALAVGFMLGVPFLMYAIGGPKLLDYFGLSHFNK
mgnify:CR=1 FL=1